MQRYLYYGFIEIIVSEFVEIPIGSIPFGIGIRSKLNLFHFPGGYGKIRTNILLLVVFQ